MKRAGEQPFLAVLLFFSAVLLIMSLLMNIRVTAQSEESEALEAECAALLTENRILKAEYESAVNLEEIERYAVEILGMQRREAYQVVYVPQG